MIWTASDRFDPAAVALADRHYNRRQPGTNQFVPPGRCLVFRAPGAVWATSWQDPEFATHQWPGAWINTCFRKECDGIASEFIRDAVAATRAEWPHVPALGMISFLDPRHVKPRIIRKRVTWAYSYFAAGFVHVGYSAKGLWVMQLVPERMPAAEPARGSQGTLELVASSVS